MADRQAQAASAGPIFCTDGELGYRRSLTDFASGPLLLDEPYRLAHLPLVAPNHPRVIARQEGRSYEMGVHPPIFSLVLPVDGALLAGSEPFRRLDTEMRAAPFASKIAWDILPRRSERLHATLCGTLSTGMRRSFRTTPATLSPASRPSRSICADCFRATSIVGASICGSIRKAGRAEPHPRHPGRLWAPAGRPLPRRALQFDRRSRRARDRRAGGDDRALVGCVAAALHGERSLGAGCERRPRAGFADRGHGEAGGVARSPTPPRP